MQSHAHIIAVLENEFINQTPDEYQPLLQTQHARDSQFFYPTIERVPFIPLPKKKFLLDEIEICIAILEQAKLANHTKNIKKHQQSQHLCTLFCMVTIFLSLGVSTSMFALMWVMMEKMFDHMIEHLQSKLLTERSLLSDAKQQLDELNSEDIAVNQKLGKDGKELGDIYDAWYQKTNANGDDCEHWTDKNGKTIYLRDIFPNYDDDMCYFKDNGVTHPLPRCNELANEGCSVKSDFNFLESQDYGLQLAISKTQNNITNLNHEIAKIEKSLHDPKPQPEPISTTFFAITALVATIVLIFAVVKWKRKIHTKHDSISEHDLSRVLSLRQINQMVNVMSRLKIHHVDKMNIDDLLFVLKNEAKSIKERMKIVGYFFSSEATQQLIQHDTSFDVIRIIMDHAGLTRK
ncbi:MAG: hypothetical protein A3F11_01545 [Gammaproteobacteria bacterium RIFCSPHIGHO2_12_FULL_37_14]|nr:MAG: hypothetical protein A3F11_01545 [Gammaproteobacteria bacterium RIFCSPHIGHO2_12_FULL_37_14]